MRKIFIYLLFFFSPIISFADGHLTEDQKKILSNAQEFTMQIV